MFVSIKNICFHRGWNRGRSARRLAEFHHVDCPHPRQPSMGPYSILAGDEMDGREILHPIRFISGYYGEVYECDWRDFQEVCDADPDVRTVPSNDPTT